MSLLFELGISKFIKSFQLKQYTTELFNVVGWRNAFGTPDRFDDFIGVYWYEGSRWDRILWPATTQPGLHWMLQPLNPKGTAIMVPGQYKSTYILGSYKGYTVLRQNRAVKVYRDNNRDSVFDEESSTIDEGLFGIHVHKAGLISILVGKWSAGCQVFKKAEDFKEFISICEQYRIPLDNQFTYTLLEY